MTLKMALKWKNADASADINLRYKDVFQKGFVYGGTITPSGVSLEVDVEPFVLVTFDGTVVTNDAAETLTVVDGDVNYVVCRARYRLLDSPILSLEVLEAAAYAGDPELDWLHVVATVDLSAGGPYANVPGANVLYVARDEIDQQGRSFWRDPVATAAGLPTDGRNREGDTRLALDTGSLYWWNEGGSIWEVFDEVPLQSHRDVEHSNGITGDSAATTLEPDVSGTDITIDAVPVGSGYTVDGRYRTIPAALVTIGAGTVGAVRGLIQVAMDDTGATVENFIVEKSADPLDIAFARISNISDGHPAGTFTLLWDNAATTLSWNGGEPVVVVTGSTYRLYGPTGTAWIDVVLSGAAPGVNVADNYDVVASLKDDDHLLVGYWFWDGAAVLTLGADKRVFGNLDYTNLSDDFKNNEYLPRWDELRGNMIYSGGTCSQISGLNLRVTGPIVAYVAGQRFEVDGTYTGTAIPAASTRYIYVDDTGTLVISATDPGTVAGLQYAEVASVVTDGANITSILDRRDPQIIVGNSTRKALVRFADGDYLAWVPSVSRLDVVTGGVTDTSGSIVRAGEIWSQAGIFTSITGGLFSGTMGELDLGGGGTSASMRFTDDNTGGFQQFTTGSDNDLADYQPLKTEPSLFGVLADGQAASRYGVGIISGCAPTIGAAVSVDIATGSLIDNYGRRVHVDGTENVVIAGSVADGVYAIYWDPATPAFASVRLDDGGGCSMSQLPLAIAVVNGGNTAVATVTDIRRMADGQFDKGSVTVGATEANFTSLKAAMLHVKCFDEDEPGARTIKVISSYTETFDVAINGCIQVATATPTIWTRPSRLNGLKIIGASNRTSSSTQPARPVITWGSGQEGFLIDFNFQVQNITIEGVTFEYAGNANVANDDIAAILNPGRDLKCHNVVFDGNNNLTHLVAWDAVTVDLGGSVGFPSSGTEFVACGTVDPVEANGEMFYFGTLATTIIGRLSLRGCALNSTIGSEPNGIIRAEAVTPVLDSAYFTIDDCVITNATYVFMGLNVDAASVSLINSTLTSVDQIDTGGTPFVVVVSNCRFVVDVGLLGAKLVSGCQGFGSVATEIRLGEGATITGCDFGQDNVTVKQEGFAGSPELVSDSKLNMGNDGIITIRRSLFSQNPLRTTFRNVAFTKSNNNAASNTVIQNTASTDVELVIDNCTIEYTGSSTDVDPVIALSAPTLMRASIHKLKCDTGSGSGVRSATVIECTSINSVELEVSECHLKSFDDAVISVDRAAGTAVPSLSKVYIRNSTIIRGGTPGDAIYIAGGPLGDDDVFIDALDLSGNVIDSAGNTLDITFVRHATVTRNQLFGRDTELITLGGAITGTSTRQRALVFTDNIMRPFTDAAVVANNYTSVVIKGNDIVIDWSASTDTVAAQIAVADTGGFPIKTAVIDGNTILASNSNAGALLAIGNITVAGVRTGSINGNVIRSVVGSNNTATATIVATSSNTNIACNGNTLSADEGGGGVTATATIAVTAVNKAAFGNVLATTPPGTESITLAGGGTSAGGTNTTNAFT